MRKFSIILFAALTIAAASPVFSQIGGNRTAPSDNRVKKILDASEAVYEIDEDGDFKVLIAFDNDRSQIAYINSSCENLDNLEIREVWSIAYIADGRIPEEVLRVMLKQNQSMILGAWRLVELPGSDFAIFAVQIDADADQDSLRTALQTVTTVADEFEKAIVGTDNL